MMRNVLANEEHLVLRTQSRQSIGFSQITSNLFYGRKIVDGKPLPVSSGCPLVSLISDPPSQNKATRGSEMEALFETFLWKALEGIIISTSTSHVLTFYAVQEKLLTKKIGHGASANR